jgi:3-oxoacyl-[acyl-carrier protein] reductase
MSLRGKVSIVTGGSRGIGKAIAEEFAHKGSRVIFTYLNSDSAAKSLVDEIKYKGGQAEAVKSNARNFEDARKIVEATVDKYGGIDILVNNAGVVKDKALMMMDPAEWHEVIDTNLTGYFNMAKACIVTMLKQRRGNIINISSVAGVIGMARQVNYSSAKAGIIGFTKSLAKEVGAYGIRVNAVAPGYIETDMTNTLKGKEDILKLIPCGRFGKSEEIAKAVAFLVSDEARYITGQTIKVDGGLAI